MLYPIHRLKVMFALSLTLAAIIAAPAAARFDNTSGLTPTTSQPSAQPSTNLCSEVCLSAITARHSFLTAPHDPPQIVTGNVTTSHGPTPTVIRVTKHGDTFSWGDAAVGAGVAIGLMALIAGGAGASAARRSRRLGESSATAAS